MSRVIAKVVQETTVDPVGWSRLQLYCSIDQRDSLEVSLRRGQAPNHLSLDGWQDSECWIPVEDIQDGDDCIEFYFPPELNRALVKTTVVIRLRSADTNGLVIDDARVAWPALLLAGAADSAPVEAVQKRVSLTAPGARLLGNGKASSDVPEISDEPLPLASDEPDTLLEASDDQTSEDEDEQAPLADPNVAETGEPDEDEDTVNTRKTGKKGRGLIIALALLVAVTLGAYWWIMMRDGDDPIGETQPEDDTSEPVADEESAEEEVANAQSSLDATEDEELSPDDPFDIAFTTDAIKSWIDQAGPSGDDVKRQGDRFKENGHDDLAVALYRNAERNGSTAAAKIIAKWYDPATFDPESSPVSEPNGETAARYYENAAKDNDPEALFRGGALMVEGQTTHPNAKVEGMVLIEKAAEQGYAPAKQYLENL